MAIRNVSAPIFRFDLSGESALINTRNDHQPDAVRTVANAGASWERVPIKRVDSLDIVLKVVEVCNIACTYCYYYFSGDDSWKSRPKVISQTTVFGVVDWIKAAAEELDVQEVSITFHGGEPLLIRQDKFCEICETIETELKGYFSNISLYLQTNGMLIDPDWIEIFIRYRIKVGVSVDGPPEYNDIYRIDKRGQGTGSLAIEGLRKLIRASDRRSLIRPGVLAVINPEFDYRSIYKYFRGLGVTWIDFLTPAVSYIDGVSQNYIAGVNRARRVLLDSWLEEDQPDEVTVRFVQHHLSFFRRRYTSKSASSPDRSEPLSVAVISIGSNGDLGVREEIMATGWPQLYPKVSIKDITANEFVNADPFLRVARSQRLIPDDCRSCQYVGWCRGGELKNRYSEESGFNNRSLFCEGIKELSSRTLEYLSSSGYPEELMLEKLGVANEHACNEPPMDPKSW